MKISVVQSDSPRPITANLLKPHLDHLDLQMRRSHEVENLIKVVLDLHFRFWLALHGFMDFIREQRQIDRDLLEKRASHRCLPIENDVDMKVSRLCVFLTHEVQKLCQAWDGHFELDFDEFGAKPIGWIVWRRGRWWWWLGQWLHMPGLRIPTWSLFGNPWRNLNSLELKMHSRCLIRKVSVGRLWTEVWTLAHFPS